MNFSESEKLGKGGSGCVYKGMFPEDGGLVAVEYSRTGVKAFNAELNIISELRCSNLVKLKGWCHDYGKFMIVYDCMPDCGLDYFLFNYGCCVKLNWVRQC